MTNSLPYQYPLGEVTAREATAATSAAASITAAAAAGGTASLLATIGVASNVIPVVGQVASAVLLVTGYIIAAQQKSKAVKNQISNSAQQAVELRKVLADADDYVLKAQQSKQNILADINKLGLSGLGGFSDWLKKTFTPVAYQKDILADANAEVASLEAQIEQRKKFLETIKGELTDLYDKLTYGKLKRTILWGGCIVVGVTVLYFLNKEFKWIKL